MAIYIIAGLKEYEKALEVASEISKELGTRVKVLLSPSLKGIMVNGLYVDIEEDLYIAAIIMSLVESSFENMLLACCA